MNKLTLDLDELRVDSFETTKLEDERGTVQAFSAWSDDSVCPTVNPSRRICPV
ncbi:MAG TPA: hypothetical protein VJT67_02500 [Longimicrobiaceae bacterium]|nr:hypothetical protein [Longimicrobiaceae bacterium]